MVEKVRGFKSGLLYVPAKARATAIGLAVRRCGHSLCGEDGVRFTILMRNQTHDFIHLCFYFGTVAEAAFFYTTVRFTQTYLRTLFGSYPISHVFAPLHPLYLEHASAPWLRMH